ncbi:MAG: glycosyl transferase family 2 [Planctomyces sp.]|nr:glycosyl transferase family 2 [Planctomyces sp.]
MRLTDSDPKPFLNKPVTTFSIEILDGESEGARGEEAHPLMKIERILQSASRPDAHAQRTVVVFPAYNVARTLEKTVHQLPDDLVDEIILVDDGSTDQTVRIARGLGLRIFRHPKSRGYGANLKMCYMHALERGGDNIIVLNPNSQYDGRLIANMIEILESDCYDIVVGSRLCARREDTRDKIPLRKYAANRFLTSMHNVLLRQKLTDCFSSFRGYRRRVLKRIPFLRNSDGYVFDSQILAQASHFGFRITELPVTGGSSDRSWQEDVHYGMNSMKVLASYCAHKAGLRRRSIFHG